MKKVLHWIITYPVTFVSLLLVLTCMVWLVLLGKRGSAFMSEMAGRQADVRKIETYRSTGVQVPPEHPDHPPRRLSITINEVAIAELRRAYEKMDDEASNIFRLAVDINRDRHLPMDDNLFPETSDAATPYEAKFTYMESFAQMFGPYSPNALLPRMNAGDPIASEALAQVVDQVRTQFLTSTLVERRAVSELSLAEQEQLRKEMQDAMLRAMRSHAESMHVYAQRDPRSAAYPFDVGSWSRMAGSPSMAQIWEGQMGLWIQQDIVQAIADANDVGNRQASVMTAPVKQLIKIEVIPGYVGIDTGGGLTGGRGSGPSSAKKPDEKMPDDFSIAPTGRRSNAIYDVRHARVTVLADYQRLAEFLAAIAKVNFMTVLDMRIEQVDEYAMMRSGYIFGEGDVVKVTCLIETVWLRDWTRRLMPTAIKEQLGVAMAEVAG